MAQLKVLHVCHKPPFPVVDGGTRAMHAIAEALDKAGCELTLATFCTHRHPLIETANSLYRQVVSLNIDTVVKKLQVIKGVLGLHTTSVHLSRFGNHVPELLNKAGHLNNFDVILLDSLYSAGNLDWIKSNFEGILLLRSHNVEHVLVQNRAKDAGRLLQYFLKMEAKLLQQEEIQILHRVDGILSISGNDTATFRNLNISTPTLATPLSFHPASSPHPLPNELSIGYIGAFDWPPNYDGFIWFLENVWPEVYAGNPSIRFMIAGKSMPEALKEELADVSNVSVLGQVEDAERFITDRSLMVAPVFGGSGVRVKVLEAMSLGRVVVTTPIGIQGIDSQQKTAVVTDNPIEMAAAILELLNDSSQLRSIGLNAFNHVQTEHDQTTIGRSIVSFCHQLKTQLPS